MISEANEKELDIANQIADLLLEKEKLQKENKQLKKQIKSADEFCDRYMGVRLELFDMYELLNKIREILGGEENGMWKG